MEPDWVEESIRQVQQSQDRVLNLSHRNIAVLPSSIESLHALHTLLLNNNRLVMPPSELVDLENLSELLLDHNELTMLPCGIGRLRNLTLLSVSYNPLGVLPSEIGDLTNLTHLWAVDTQVNYKCHYYHLFSAMFQAVIQSQMHCLDSDLRLL